MVDPTSDLEEDVSEEDAPTCAACGAAIVDSPRHRVLTWVEDGQVQSRHFCDDGCRMDWDGETAR
ncbi:MAG: hypothetical protein V5A39_06795 [Haloarculaceae archaeon]